MSNPAKFSEESKQYQFVCNTCSEKEKRTNDSEKAQQQAKAHKTANPKHIVDILIHYSIKTFNNFQIK